MITVLCGGVGGSRFLRALTSVVEPERITAVINTGDDDEFHGLWVSPDPDIVTYALAGEVDERGWGLRADTFRWLASLERFGRETWFRIGDRDLATHLHRTQMRAAGATPSGTVAAIARAFGVRTRLLPMSDDRVRTVIDTDSGALPFQRYLVQRRASDPVRAVRFEGAAEAAPAPGVLDALRDSEAIFIAPSNPIGSIGPILAIPAIRHALAARRSRTVAISPIVGGRSLQPPAGEMLRGLGYGESTVGVARVYAQVASTLIVDPADAAELHAVEATGLQAVIAPALMTDAASSRGLALAALSAAGVSA